MYYGYITTIKDIRKHSNADRLQCVTVFGNTAIVDLSYKEGQRVIYFPVDGQLSEKFCEDNNLVRKKDADGNNVGGYLDPRKRNITAIKLRGEKSDGLVMPIECLAKYTDISSLKDGDKIDILNGHEICKKYVPKRNKPKQRSGHKQKQKAKKKEYPFFVEHVDTAQLAYNQGAFRFGDTCYITLKAHGSSGRSGHTLRRENRRFKFLNKWFGQKKTWEVVSGSRRVVLDDEFKDGYYNNEFRKKWHDFFKDKLPKGTEVFYEIVGYTTDGTPLMGSVSNKKIKDKEFQRQYGDTTVFSYGCEVGESDCYVYRITMTNEDGYVVELPWEQVQIECEKMGAKCVPTFEKFIYKDWDDLMKRVEKYYDGVDPIGKTHIREGVVVRIDNRPTFEAYKHKNFNFKCLAGIIVDNADADNIDADLLSEM